MKKLNYISIVILFILYNCNTINKEKSQDTEPVKEMETEQQSESDTNNETPVDLTFLKQLIGKYPTQEKIFENKLLADRLKNLSDFDFEKMTVNWNTETPLSIEDQIIHSSGCKANNCPSNGYELFIDLKNDNINIFYFRGNTLKVYTEKDWIDLPKIYQDELEIKKSNAKIGSIDETESTYDITPLSYSPHNSNKETANKINVFLKGLLKNDLATMTEEQRKFHYEEVDLNDDKTNEYLVGFKNS